jgi:TIR domain
MTEKRVFISYSHDSEAHKDWVRGLAEFLMKNGIEIVFDQWDVRLGDDLPGFMEKGIRDTDRVLVICTDAYIQKANSGSGGVGYEKTIVTTEIMSGNRRKFIPVIRAVAGDNKMPTFFGAALYLDLSDGKDGHEPRHQLIREIYDVPPSKPGLGIPFIPSQAPTKEGQSNRASPGSLGGADPILEFSNRFGRAFPGVRGIQWIDDEETIAERLSILLKQPLVFEKGTLAGWWRGPQNLHIDQFEHIESSHFLMNDVEELNIRRIAAVNPNIYHRKFVYVETREDPPTGLYPSSPDDIIRQIETFGYANEEYGLVDDRLPVTRAEYDDGAAIIESKPVDIIDRVVLRLRYITPYNFLIAPFESPINNSAFDDTLLDFLNRLLQSDDVFAPMCNTILRLPKKNF